MANRKQRYGRAQLVFGMLFILSIVVLLVLSLLPQDEKSVAGESASGFPSGGIVGVLSLLASITTLVGFVSTTVLEWREERREAAAAELERQRQELEIQKLRKELDEMRDKG
jgi:uncharacterized membrane protein